jgi:hypothetical protein
MERVVVAMRADGEGIVLTATDDELDELIGFVAGGSSTHSATLMRTADLMALPELEVVRVQWWCAARGA